MDLEPFRSNDYHITYACTFKVKQAKDSTFVVLRDVDCCEVTLIREYLQNLQNNELEEFVLRSAEDEEAKVILDLLQNKELKMLILNISGTSEFDFTNLDVLKGIFHINTVLRDVSVLRGTADGLEYIIDGTLNNPGCKLVNLSLKTWKNERKDVGCSYCHFAKHLTNLLRENRTTHLLLDTSNWMTKDCSREGVQQSVAKGLAVNTTLTHLQAREPLINYICEALTPPDECSPLQNGYNKTLQSLKLYYGDILNERIRRSRSSQSLSKMLQNNHSLKRLLLINWRCDSEFWIPVFHSLSFNKSLQSLRFWHCSGFDDCTFNSLVELLDGNFTIQSIEFRGTPVNDERRLRMLLERNRRVAKYTSFFEKLEYTQPKLVRLFLCGAPFAGKTTLGRTMVKSSRATLPRVMKQLERFFGRRKHEERTQGIEVRVLLGDNRERIAIWDMAGQEEYRALYDSHYLFPEIDQGCLFLFVFRPIDTNTGKFEQQVALDRLKEEFCYWLGFINSNSRMASVRFPQIFVVLTHWDKIGGSFLDADDYVKWASDAVQEIGASFSGQVEVHQKIYAVDSHSQDDVRGVVDHIFTHFRDVSTKLPKMPAICQEMSDVLAKWNFEHKFEPLLKKYKFFEVCQQALPKQFQDVLKGLDQQAMEVGKWDAILSYLNDVGWIVTIGKLDCIVVDVNWLGRDFLGKLFNSKHLQEFLPFSKNGIVDVFSLKKFLKSDFIDTGRYQNLDVDILIELMKELKICESTSLSLGELSSSSPHLFMPSTLKDDERHAYKGTRRLKWTELQLGRGYNPVYIGFRLRCMDPERTFLSPGVFLRYQVHLLRMLRKLPEGESQSFHYELERNLIRVKHDGMEMLIESSGELRSAEFVDILIRILVVTERRKQRAYQTGVSEFQLFCASGDGCPGVTLQELILRPECVEKLISCKNRFSQAVSKEYLRKKLEASQQGIGGTQKSCSDGDYMHRFPAVEDSDEPLLEDWIKASELLDLTNIPTILEDSAIDVTEINRVVEDVSSCPEESSSLIVSEVTDDAELCLTGTLPEASDDDRQTCPRASTSLIVSEGTNAAGLCQNDIFPVPSDDGRQRDLCTQVNDVPPWVDSIISFQHLLLRSLDAIRAGQDVVMEDLDSIMRDQSSMVTKQDLLMQAFQRHHGVLMDKFCQIYQVLQPSLPKLPYFTGFDISWSKKFISHINLARPSKLHFMCESPDRIHCVRDQEGLQVDIFRQGKLYKKLRPLIWKSFVVLWILVKTGLHVGAGIGNMLSDIGEEAGVGTKASFLTAETITNEMKISEKSEVDANLENAWKCLIDEVVGPKKDQIPKFFGLRKVTYKASRLQNPESTPVHWICDECQNSACREDLLEVDHDITPKGRLSKKDVKN